MKAQYLLSIQEIEGIMVKDINCVVNRYEMLRKCRRKYGKDSRFFSERVSAFRYFARDKIIIFEQKIGYIRNYHPTLRPMLKTRIDWAREEINKYRTLAYHLQHGKRRDKNSWYSPTDYIVSGVRETNTLTRNWG